MPSDREIDLFIITVKASDKEIQGFASPHCLKKESIIIQQTLGFIVLLNGSLKWTFQIKSRTS